MHNTLTSNFSTFAIQDIENLPEYTGDDFDTYADAVIILGDEKFTGELVNNATGQVFEFALGELVNESDVIEKLPTVEELLEQRHKLEVEVAYWRASSDRFEMLYTNLTNEE